MKIVRFQRDQMCDSKELKTVFTVNQWVQRRQSKLNKQSALSYQKRGQRDAFALKSSLLTLFVITVTWSLGTLQVIFVWGMAFPFAVIYMFQGFIHFALFGMRSQPCLNQILQT